MTGVVTATGNNTFFGRTAKLVAAAGSASHSQKAVLQIGDFLILVAFALALVLVGVEVYRQIVVADVLGLERRSARSRSSSWSCWSPRSRWRCRR